MISRGTGYVSGRHPRAHQRLVAHVKYLRYRTGIDRGERTYFSATRDDVKRQDVTHDIAAHGDAFVAYHKMVLSPDAEERASIGDDWQLWTREVMHDLEARKGLQMTWYAMYHNNTDNPHVHVILAGEGIDDAGDAATVRLFREDYMALDRFGYERAEVEFTRLAREVVAEEERIEAAELESCAMTPTSPTTICSPNTLLTPRSGMPRNWTTRSLTDEHVATRQFQPQQQWVSRIGPAWWSVIAVYAVWALMLSRDYWLGTPLLAVAWVATHIGAMGQNVVLMSKHKVGQPPLKLTWPAWTWQDFTAWYRPSIAAQWHHIWHDPNLSIPTRNLLLVLARHPLPGDATVVTHLTATEVAQSITHGSAHHASVREVAAFRRPAELPTLSGIVAATLTPLPHLPVPLRTMQTWAAQRQARRPKPPTSIPIGRYHGRMLWLSQSQQEEMILLTAPTGAGKTTGFIIPALLSERGARSLYIPDPKSELWRLTSGAIAETITWRFAPAQPDQSMGYNPLAYVTDRRSARRFAECFLRNTGGINERDMYWNNIAISLMIGAISHVQAIETDPPLHRLVTWFTTMTLEYSAALLTASPSADARRARHVLIDAMQKNPKVAGAVSTDLAARWDHLQSEELPV